MLNRAAGISKSEKYVLFAYTRTDRQTDRQTTLTYLSSVRVLQAGGRCVLSCAEVFSKYGGINNGAADTKQIENQGRSMPTASVATEKGYVLKNRTPSLRP